MSEQSVQEYGRTADWRQDKNNAESESVASVYINKPEANWETDVYVPEVWESIYT